MSQQRLPPPDVKLASFCPRVEIQGRDAHREDVADLAMHLARLCRPGGYRPPWCPRCNGTTLHVHDYLERHLRSEGECVVCASFGIFARPAIARRPGGCCRRSSRGTYGELGR